MVVTCNHCGQRARATAAHAGRSVPCPACRATIHVSPLVPLEELVAETSPVNSSPQPTAASSDPLDFSTDEYRLAATPVPQTTLPAAAAPAPQSKVAAWLGCSDELHRERKRILLWWAVPFGVLNAVLLVMHPLLFILSAPFSLVCFGGGILIFAEALYMPFWESRRFRWIRALFSKESYR